MLVATFTALGQEMRTVFPVWQWRCDSGNAVLNFNPAEIVDSTHPLVFNNLPYAKNYTVVVVYKPIVKAEAAVWKIDYDTESVRSLTTEHIISNNTTIRYTDSTGEVPVINTLRQSAPDSVTPYVRLTLGGDTLPGVIKVAEILYFDRRIDNTMLRRVQSALAIRYGITLGPVDYVDGKGNTFWQYADGGLYHHRVTGIGQDSTFHIYQFQSCSEMPNPILTVWTDSIPEGEFFVCGDNDAPLSFNHEGETEILARRWRASCTDVDNNYFHLTFSTRGFSSIGDSLVLLADGDVFFPSFATPEIVSFRNVTFSSDTSTFTLARGSVFWQSSMSKSKGSPYCGNEEETVKSFLYPNPTTGEYTLEVSGTPWVKVNIYNAQGVLLDSHSAKEQKQYLFNGSLPAGNSYYATVTTENGVQTMKLIVK